MTTYSDGSFSFWFSFRGDRVEIQYRGVSHTLTVKHRYVRSELSEDETERFITGSLCLTPELFRVPKGDKMSKQDHEFDYAVREAIKQQMGIEAVKIAPVAEAASRVRPKWQAATADGHVYAMSDGSYLVTVGAASLPLSADSLTDWLDGWFDVDSVNDKGRKKNDAMREAVHKRMAGEASVKATSSIVGVDPGPRPSSFPKINGAVFDGTDPNDPLYRLAALLDLHGPTLDVDTAMRDAAWMIESLQTTNRELAQKLRGTEEHRDRLMAHNCELADEAAIANREHARESAAHAQTLLALDRMRRGKP